MEHPVFHPIGTQALELDTPALVVELDAVEANIARFHETLGDAGVRVRPDGAAHGCPNIARVQMEAASSRGSASGIRVNTVGEAEAFADAGVGDIYVASPVVTAPKIARLCRLARRAKISVAVESATNATGLSEAARESGVVLGVAIAVDGGQGVVGLEPGEAVLSVAGEIARLSGLSLLGLNVLLPIPGPGNVVGERTGVTGDEGLKEALGIAPQLAVPGGSPPEVSVSGGEDIRALASTPGVTEIQPPDYGLVGYNRLRGKEGYEASVRVLSQVISHPTEGSAVVDAGHKSTGPDLGLPVVDGMEGAQATRFSAEHGVMQLEEGPARVLKPGDKVWLAPFDLELCANQYDYFRAVRQGRLEGYWPIAARGRFS